MNVIFFGDSNTYGYDPCSYMDNRYPSQYRWVDILAEKTGWHIVNAGQNGRTIPRRGVCVPEDTELFAVMLGTNDILQGSSAAAAAEKMDSFLNELPIVKDKILLIAPPPLERGAWVPEQRMVDESMQLAEHYRALAARLGAAFADAGAWKVSLAFDGIHFTEEGSRAFAEGLYRVLAG